jgi:hypothetical protein
MVSRLAFWGAVPPKRSNKWGGVYAGHLSLRRFERLPVPSKSRSNGAAADLEEWAPGTDKNVKPEKVKAAKVSQPAFDCYRLNRHLRLRRSTPLPSTAEFQNIRPSREESLDEPYRRLRCEHPPSPSSGRNGHSEEIRAWNHRNEDQEPRLEHIPRF